MTVRSATAALALVLCAGLASCASSGETTMKPKKRPPLPGEDVNEMSWNRPTGPNDIHTPFGMPMSR